MFLNKGLLIFIILQFCILLNGSSLPFIRIGFQCDSDYKTVDNNQELVIPSTLTDHLLFLYKQKYVSFFQLQYRFDIYYTNYNKKIDDLADLKKYHINNQIIFSFFIRKKHCINFSSKPMVYYHYDKYYIKLRNNIEYKLKLKKFTFQILYSHLITSKDSSDYLHKFKVNFFWKHPRYEALKFKTYCNVYFQYKEKNPDLSFLKSINFYYEMAIDFSKADFEEIFSKGEEDDFY